MMFRRTMAFILMSLVTMSAMASTAASAVSNSSAKLDAKVKNENRFVFSVAGTLRSEHEASGESSYRNFPSFELGYSFSSHQLSLLVASYSTATGNSTLATSREFTSALVLYSEKLVSDKMGDLEGSVGVGAYQEKIISRLYLTSTEDVSEWQSQASVGIRYLFRLNSYFYSGPSVQLGFAKNFDPNPMLDLSWGLRAQF